MVSFSRSAGLFRPVCPQQFGDLCGGAARGNRPQADATLYGPRRSVPEEDCGPVEEWRDSAAALGSLALRPQLEENPCTPVPS